MNYSMNDASGEGSIARAVYSQACYHSLYTAAPYQIFEKFTLNLLVTLCKKINAFITMNGVLGHDSAL